MYLLSQQQPPIQDVELSAGGSPGNRLLMSYHTPDSSDYGDGDLIALDLVYRRGFTFGLDYRLYTFQDMLTEDYALTEISTNGDFSAVSGQSGCSWSGQITVPNPLFNMFNVDFEVTSCGELDGSYACYGYHADGYEYYYDRVIFIYAHTDSRPMALVLIPRG